MSRFRLPAGAAKTTRRQRVILWIKAAVTVAILVFLLTRIDLRASGRAFLEADAFWLAFAFLVNSLALITSSFKWDGLLRALKVFSSRWRLLELYTIGHFMSCFLPGIVGGDVVRWHLTGTHTGERLKAAASILLERVTGVIALVALCPLIVLFVVPEFATVPVVTLIAATVAALVCGLALALNRWLATVLMFRTRRLPIRPLLRPIYKLHRTLRRTPMRPLVVALGWSVLFYLSIGLVFYAICRAFDAEITFLEAASNQALISLLLLVPVSIGGLGLAQAGDVYLLGLLGIGAPEALAMSIARLFIKYGYAVVGGALFIRWGGRPGTADADNHTAGRTRSRLGN